MKRRITQRIWTWLTLLASGGTLFQVIGGFTDTTGATRAGCRDFWVNGINTSVDFCYLLDCQNGFLGGLVQPCGPNSLLTDCQNINIGNGTGTDTDTNTGTQGINTGTGTGTGTNTGTRTNTGTGTNTGSGIAAGGF